MKPHVLPVSIPKDPSPYYPMIKSAVAASALSTASSAAMLMGSGDELGDAVTRILMPPPPEEDKKNEERPLIPRTSSYTEAVSSNSYKQQKRRRRVASDNSLLTLDGGGRRSLRLDAGRDASDSYLVTRLVLNLLRYIGVGYRLMTRFLALGCYSFLLFPGFLQVGYYYFFSNRVRRGIVYGDLPRNRLDLYSPKNSDGPKPVVAFLTGGARILGYKAWGSLLGQQLSDRDIMLACIDYRNFPQATIGDMVKDASQGISFICNNIAEYGGDPNRVYVMGQSAGAHIAACALLERVIKEASKDKISWSVAQIKAYFGLSGGYNLLSLVDHFHSRGLYRSIFLSIMEGEESLRKYSPEVTAQDPSNRNGVSLLPPIILLHGNADNSIPSVASTSFAETLRNLGVQAESIIYEGKTHTDLILQDPMRGGRDDMFEDLVGMVHAGDSEALARDSTAPPKRRLVPEFMLKLARSVSSLRTLFSPDSIMERCLVLEALYIDRTVSDYQLWSNINILNRDNLGNLLDLVVSFELEQCAVET